MSEHPPAFRLDAHVAGDLDPDVTAHVASCESCAAYVAQTTADAAAFGAKEGKTAADFVLALGDLEARRRRPTARAWRIGVVAAPFLAAALLFLVLRPRAPGPELPANEPAIRFKGKLQVAVVRERAGDQTRVLGEVRVRPGDRLRVEVALDDARPLAVGFLGRDGTWLLLQAPLLAEAGTHFSERAARFDDTPTEGVLLAGHPDAVERARTTRAFDDVVAVPVVVEP